MKNNKIKRTNKKPDKKNQNSSPDCGIKSDNKSNTIENYIPNAFDAQIDECDSMIYFDDLYSDNNFTADDLSFELHFELELQNKLITASQLCPDENTKDKVRLLKARQKILEDLRSYLTSRELYVLDYSISTYASVCDSPWERRKEIGRTIYALRNWFEVNSMNWERFSDKIDKIDLIILFELTEIILNSEVIRYCAWDPEKSLHYPFLDKLSAILNTQHYGSFDIDTINEDDFYKEQFEHVFFSDLQFEDEYGYQYYYDEIDLGEMEGVEIYEIEASLDLVEYQDEYESVYNPKSTKRVLNDEDYELEINETKHIYIEDLYFELWKELTWDIDIIVIGICCKEDRVELTREECDFAANVLSSVSELLTPKQLLALYYFSGNEAQSTSYADKRWQLISEEMAKSQKLQEFDIVDFQDYCRKIYKIKPLVFLKLTDILYESRVIRPLCIKQNNALEGFERYMNSLTWQST